MRSCAGNGTWSGKRTRFGRLSDIYARFDPGDWRVDNLKSDEFLEEVPRVAPKGVTACDPRAFDQSSKTQLREVGGQARELVKVARGDGQSLLCTLVHRPKAAQEEFKRERYLTGKETEHRIIYFKLYKSQCGIDERALEIAALMLGSDKSGAIRLK